MPLRRATASSPAPATASLAAYAAVRALIVRGRLLPGARVTEADVAAELRVSRTPAREALRRLRQERLLVPAGAGDGAKVRLAVAPMTAAEARELYTAAGALEGVAARSVAACDAAARRALAAALATAQAAFRREATRRAPDWDRLFERHHGFHERLRAGLAGPRLRLLLDGLRPHLDRYEYFYGRLHGTGFEATFAEHDAIVAAVAAGRADGAEGAVRANWFNGAERLAAAVQRAGEAGVLRAPAADGAADGAAGEAHARSPAAAAASRSPRTPADDVPLRRPRDVGTVIARR
jgi:DNA-binding GntR family transcriptional regulator